MTLVNTIIANSFSGGDCVNSLGIVEDNGHNLIEDGALVADGGCLDNATSHGGEPWLARLDYYGGPSTGSGAEVLQTHELLPNSPALNSGDDAACPTTDQRGFPRLGRCDMGAVESQGFSINIVGGDQQTTLVDTAFPDPLDVSLRANNDYLVVGEGQIVTYTAPLIGASLTNPTFTGTTDVDNWISIPVTANTLAGRYAVTVTVNNLLTPTHFTLTNTAGNNAPVLDPMANPTISETYGVSFTVTASDPDSDGLTFSVSDAPDGATFDDTTGRFTWTPTDEQGPGVYTMTVMVTDDGAPLLSDSMPVVITVLDVPLAFGQEITTDEDQAVDFTLFGLSAHDSITYNLATIPVHGTVSGSAPDLTYMPEADYAGSDSFTFQVSDGLVASTLATVTITVNPINEAPTAVEQSLTVQEDTGITITLSATDPDGATLT